MRARAAYLDAFGAPFVVEDVAFDDPGPRQVLVRTTAAPFCSTDWLGWRGMRGKRPPVVLGHTGVGVVLEVGDEVADLAVGDRVVVAGTPECGECFWCGIGRPDQCAVLFEQSDPEIATSADGRRIRAAGRVGSYAELMLAGREQVWRAPGALPDDIASLLGCGILTGVGAVRNVAKVRPGQSVAVVGLGHLGLWMVQAARIAGAGSIIGLDPVPHRRATALAVGATDVVDPQSGDPVELVRSRTEGRGADVVLEAAGPDTAVREAVLMARRAGTIVLTGVSDLRSEVVLPQGPLAVHGRSVLGCQNGQSVIGRDLPHCIALLESGALDASAVLTARYGLSQIGDALEASGGLRDLSGVLMFGAAA